MIILKSIFCLIILNFYVCRASYPFTCSNPNLNFSKQIELWFKKPFIKATNPPEWPGEGGVAVVIPEDLKEESENRFKENQFNIVASDLIALDRSMPDLRSKYCQEREYPENLPSTSIIIVHHNEGNSTLLRSLISIVRNTPLHLLSEIILVDDNSTDRDYLLKPLEDFVEKLPVDVKIIRNSGRLGLIKSRVVGASAAKGDTITFLDAHIEATEGWLEPLLTEVTYDRRVIVTPIIDGINENDFSLIRLPSDVRSGFNGRMEFDWFREQIGDDFIESLPARTPTMAGGLFTMNREYFYELGTYDEGMEIWGAENLEMSLRAWMCGGSLLVVPCSHVCHVYRKNTPYTYPGGTEKVIYRNNKRLINVWTDEYQTYFNKIRLELYNVDAGDVSSRLELKKKLKCKSFKWYLENIYPEAPIPHDFFHIGQIYNGGYGACIDSLGHKENQTVGLYGCHDDGGNQVFEFSKSYHITKPDINLCLGFNDENNGIFEACDESTVSQAWDYDTEFQLLRNRETLLCLGVLVVNETTINLTQAKCINDDSTLKWYFQNSLFSH